MTYWSSVTANARWHWPDHAPQWTLDLLVGRSSPRGLNSHNSVRPFEPGHIESESADPIFEASSLASSPAPRKRMRPDPNAALAASRHDRPPELIRRSLPCYLSHISWDSYSRRRSRLPPRGDLANLRAGVNAEPDALPFAERLHDLVQFGSGLSEKGRDTLPPNYLVPPPEIAIPAAIQASGEFSAGAVAGLEKRDRCC